MTRLLPSTDLYNTAEIIDEAFAKYRPANGEDLTNLAECYNNVQKLKKENETYESTYTVKINGVKEAVSAALTPFVEEYATVKNASIVDFDTETREFVIDKEKTGYEINIDGAAKAVEDLFSKGTYTGTVKVPTVVKEPEITEAMINENFGLVGSEWTITDGNSNRNNNISQALRKRLPYCNGHCRRSVRAGPRRRYLPGQHDPLQRSSQDRPRDRRASQPRMAVRLHLTRT